MDYDTSQWTELRETDFAIDIKYASEDNFIGRPIYSCGRCFLLKRAAKQLKKAADDLKQKGYRLRLYDCYRPAPSQQALWDIKPDKRYVAPPEKGSMHSRGLAIDLTLERDGQIIDMGTAFDYFGREAWPTLIFPDSSVQSHRDILQAAMKNQGFKQARSEWWHFSLPISSTLYEWQWTCPD